MDLLTVEHVTKRYASHTALDDVSLAIPKGSVYGLLGPNGAGKTTLIRIINRITAPDAGRVLFGDREIAPDDIYRIGYLPEERGLYKKMKVGEQAVFFARLKGLSRREAVARLKQWFIRFGIQEWWDKKVEELSKGMAQKVQFIVTILHEPELLIVLGLRPDQRQSAERRNPGAARQGRDDHLLDAQHVFGGGDLRPHHADQQIAQHPLGRGRRNPPPPRLQHLRSGLPLRQAVAGRCEILDGTQEESVYRTLKLHVESDADVRGVISAVNDAVELRSFREIIPSMNDIFIRAVNGSL